MGAYLTTFVGVIYLLVAFSEYQAGRPGFALMFVGYALANVGVVWSMNG